MTHLDFRGTFPKNVTSKGEIVAKTVIFINHKGGVAKTTSVVNVAVALSKRLKQPILVIDADPQGNASLVLGTVSPYDQTKTLRDVFLDPTATFTSIAQLSKYDRVDLIPSNIMLSGLTVNLPTNDPRRFIAMLQKMDAAAKEKYAFILIDCPPSIDSIFITNALIACDYYIIPIEAESSFALAGVEDMLSAIKTMTTGTNTNAKLLGVLLTMFDSRTIASKVVADATRSFFGRENVFETLIPRNAAMSRANVMKKSVFELDPKASAAQAYSDLAKEIMARVEPKG